MPVLRGGTNIDRDWYYTKGSKHPETLVAWCICETCLASGPEAPAAQVSHDTDALARIAFAAWNPLVPGLDPDTGDFPPIPGPDPEDH